MQHTAASRRPGRLASTQTNARRNKRYERERAREMRRKRLEGTAAAVDQTASWGGDKPQGRGPAHRRNALTLTLTRRKRGGGLNPYTCPSAEFPAGARALRAVPDRPSLGILQASDISDSKNTANIPFFRAMFSFLSYFSQ